MEKIIDNIYLIKFIIYIYLGTYGTFVESDFSIIWFSLAAIMAVFHFDTLIKELNKQ